MVRVWLTALLTVLLSLALETAGQGEGLPSVPSTLSLNPLSQIASSGKPDPVAQ